jgi:hypothetical protein
MDFSEINGIWYKSSYIQNYFLSHSSFWMNNIYGSVTCYSHAAHEHSLRLSSIFG